MDVDFTSAVYPFPKFRMGQTNYRIYIVDRETGERCVWFLGTTLDSWTRFVPHTLWKLPWFGGKMSFDCRVDAQGRYQHYEMHTQAQWAPVQMVLKSSNDNTMQLAGFPDQETALVYLTHPLRGFIIGGMENWAPTVCGMINSMCIRGNWFLPILVY